MSFDELSEAFDEIGLDLSHSLTSNTYRITSADGLLWVRPTLAECELDLHSALAQIAFAQRN